MAPRSRPRFYRSYKAAEMAGKPVTITNTGDAPVQAVVSVSGSPVTPEPAASNGFKIERNYFTLDGKPADVSKAKQNDRFAVVLKITEAKPEYGHVSWCRIISRPASRSTIRVWSRPATPARWTGSRTARSRRIPNSATTASARPSTGPATTSAVFTVAYIVRAVSPGKYVLPQAYVEDMYNPSRYGRTGTGTVEVRAAK